MPALREVTFQSGQIGITADWQTGVVTSVDPGGQAQQNGVQEQWAVVQVNGNKYTETLILEVLTGAEPYTLVFQPPPVPCPQGYSAESTCADCQRTQALIV